jgi:hypothetical protein
LLYHWSTAQSTMSRRATLPDNLPQLQNLIKRDPQSYREVRLSLSSFLFVVRVKNFAPRGIQNNHRHRSFCSSCDDSMQHASLSSCGPPTATRTLMISSCSWRMCVAVHVRRAVVSRSTRSASSGRQPLSQRCGRHGREACAVSGQARTRPRAAAATVDVPSAHPHAQQAAHFGH